MNANAMQQPATLTEPPNRRLFTLAKFAERHSSFITLAAITNQVFKAKPRQSTKGEISGNGMEEAGVIVRLAGRVLIDEGAYFRWVDSLQSGSQK
ncbi:MAG: hypothetical protein Q8Q28_11150 [Pseudomonadota bacterium]|nr:hypothetical protein [Pseudomonadota bacterium]